MDTLNYRSLIIAAIHLGIGVFMTLINGFSLFILSLQKKMVCSRRTILFFMLIAGLAAGLWRVCQYAIDIAWFPGSMTMNYRARYALNTFFHLAVILSVCVLYIDILKVFTGYVDHMNNTKKYIGWICIAFILCLLFSILVFFYISDEKHHCNFSIMGSKTIFIAIAALMYAVFVTLFLLHIIVIRKIMKNSVTPATTSESTHNFVANIKTSKRRFLWLTPSLLLYSFLFAPITMLANSRYKDHNTNSVLNLEIAWLIVSFNYLIIPFQYYCGGEGFMKTAKKMIHSLCSC